MGEASAGGPTVEVVSLSARYEENGEPAVRGVDVSVDAGQVVVLLGPNGAGKSTTLRVVAGLAPVHAGSVRILGRPVGEYDRRTLAHAVAFVPQSEEPAAGFTVREVVAMGRSPHLRGWMRPRAEDREAVESAIEQSDLKDVAERLVQALSGGERRRVAIARALAQKAKVLVLDEPAAHLDLRHRLELEELIAAAAHRDGMACLVAMHDLDAAARLGAHAVLLRRGHVVAAGSPDLVLTPPHIREAFDADVAVAVHEPTGARAFIPLRSAPPQR